MNKNESDEILKKIFEHQASIADFYPGKGLGFERVMDRLLLKEITHNNKCIYLDKIISNFKNNKSLYIGEKITMAEHMIQSAMLAEKAKCNDDLICSCLLHDYGHFNWKT